MKTKNKKEIKAMSHKVIMDVIDQTLENCIILMVLTTIILYETQETLQDAFKMSFVYQINFM